MAITTGNNDMVALFSGVGLGWAAEVAAARRYPHRRIYAAAAGLVAAASVYPLAESRVETDVREIVTVLAVSTVAIIAVRQTHQRARLLLGAGWIAHALFDFTYTGDPATTRLPRWYPALCAGFDIGYGVHLAAK